MTVLFNYLNVFLITSLLFALAIKGVNIWTYTRQKLKDTIKSNLKKDISIIIPIYGYDADVAQNIPHFIKLAESNQNVTWLFCLSWRDYSAKEFIKKNIGQLPNCKILVSKKNTNISDKNLNMLTGLMNITTAKVVFVDVDNQIPIDFVENFNLALESYAGVTSFAFYSSSIKRYVWWSSDITDFLRKKPLYLWGGAMGFSFDLLSKEKIMEVLKSHVHDDLPLTQLLKRNHLDFLFDINSLGKINGNNHPEKFYNWSIRLSVFGKYGLGLIWRKWLIGHVLRIIILIYLFYSSYIYFFIATLLFTFYYYSKSLITYRLYANQNDISLKYRIQSMLLYCSVMTFYEPIINIIAFFKKDLVYRNIKYSELNVNKQSIREKQSRTNAKKHNFLT